jgi:hypothetical protein
MIKQYIESGILETYVMGIATEEEQKELLRMKEGHPEVREALYQLELDMEKVAGKMAIIPPFDTWDKIEREIDELMARPEIQVEPFTHNGKQFNGQKANGNQYIEVESESNLMRIHKNWRWVFAAVFVLGKIFLGCAIYFYLENRQAQQQIIDLKTEVRTLKK